MSFATATNNSFFFFLSDSILRIINEFLSQINKCLASIEINYEWDDWFVDDFHKSSQFFFSLNQYLLEDNAYINRIYLITSYKASHMNNLTIREFNRSLSRMRIDIELAFEILKEWWKRLTRLSLRIRDQKSYIYVIQWIIACVVLHNILLNFENEWDEEEEWWTAEEEIHDDEFQNLTAMQLNKGTTKRKYVKELVLDRSNSWDNLIDQY